MVIHKTMDLFSAPKGSILVHACNSQGVWGSGIARAFKEKYPESFKQYQGFCRWQKEKRGTACGRSNLSGRDGNHLVGCIVTSHGYGASKDSREEIKIHTALALDHLCENLVNDRFNHDHENGVEVYSNKFNSGLFDVPWEETEFILKIVLAKYPKIKWIVCDPNGDK